MGRLEHAIQYRNIQDPNHRLQLLRSKLIGKVLQALETKEKIEPDKARNYHRVQEYLMEAFGNNDSEQQKVEEFGYVIRASDESIRAFDIRLLSYYADNLQVSSLGEKYKSDLLVNNSMMTWDQLFVPDSHHTISTRTTAWESIKPQLP